VGSEGAVAELRQVLCEEEAGKNNDAIWYTQKGWASQKDSRGGEKKADSKRNTTLRNRVTSCRCQRVATKRTLSKGGGGERGDKRENCTKHRECQGEIYSNGTGRTALKKTKLSKRG